jgi:hypothetical protein
MPENEPAVMVILHRILLLMRLLLFFVFLSTTTQAQLYERHYKISSDGENIGYLIARQRAEGDMVHYEITSEVTTSLVFRINLNTEIQASYEDGVLRNASATTYLNGNVHSDTKVRKTPDGYTVVKDGHETKIYASEIRFSSAKLYFHEPKEVGRSLAESGGILKKLEEVGEKKYALYAEGNESEKSVYTFSSDQGLYQIDATHARIADLKITRVRNVNEAAE